MDKLTKIFKELEKCKPYKIQTAKTKFDFFANLFLIIAVLCTGLLALLALWFLTIGFNSEVIQLVVSILDFLVSLFAVLAMGTRLVEMLFETFSWVKKKAKKKDITDTVNRALAVVSHDEKNANNFEQYEIHDLKKVSAWLQRLVKRRENRIVYFFGNQAAIYSLIIAFIYFFDRVGGIDTVITALANGFRGGSISNMIVVLFLGCFLGLILGALALKNEIGRFAYWAEIIDLVIQRKEMEKAIKENFPVVVDVVPIDTVVVETQKLSWGKRIKAFFLESYK